VRISTASILIVFAMILGEKAWAQVPAPAPTLAAQFDIFIILDESGSITSTDFQREKDFARSFVQGLTVNPTMAHVGVGAFGTVARTITPLSSSAPLVQISIASVIQASSGSTCMPCAFDMASSQFASSGRGEGTPQITLFITDGQNNVGASSFAASLTALQSVSTVFAIGVGNAVSTSQIDDIASDLDGVQTTFFITDFSSTLNLLTPLRENVALAVTAVPEPEIYAMMGIGLGLVGWVGRRRKLAT